MLFRSVLVVLLIIFGLLEYRFWFGSDSVLKVAALKNTLATHEKEIAKLRERNQQLISKIENLKSHPTVLEEQARYELGMVREGEKYYQIVEPIN